MRNKKKALLLFSGFFVFVGVVGIQIYWSVQEKPPFNASAWKTGSPFFHKAYFPSIWGNTQRAEMVDDLLAHHVRLGMTRKRVHSFLGGAEVEDGTGDHGPIDVYSLVERPAVYRWWQARLWWRYRTSEPRLALEYGGADSRLITISVD